MNLLKRLKAAWSAFKSGASFRPLGAIKDKDLHIQVLSDGRFVQFRIGKDGKLIAQQVQPQPPEVQND